jgi:hypothetical protein
VSCQAPIDAAVLESYWLGELPAGDEAPLEEHLLGCDECSRRLQSVAKLAEGIRTLARGANLPLIVTRAFLDRMAQEGLRVREYAPPAGGSVQCTVTAQDDFLIGRLAADLAGVERLDLALCDPSGVERRRLRDIPFRPARTEVIFQYPIVEARQLAANTMVAKLLAIEASGERLVAQYAFHHTPSR